LEYIERFPSSWLGVFDVQEDRESGRGAGGTLDGDVAFFVWGGGRTDALP